MKQVVVKFGLIAGGILSVFMLVTYTLVERIGFDHGEVIGYSTMVLAFLMVYFGIRSYRDNVAGGVISYGRGFLVGICITVIASACYVATWEFVYYRFAPDFADKYAAHAVEKARASGATEAQIAEQTKQMEEFKVMYRKPLYNVAMTFVEPFPVGLVFTLVCAGILRRRRDGLAEGAVLRPDVA